MTPTAAARHLGVSIKALRLYERRGLLAPARTAAGWRTYGPADLARAAEIVALRALGLSLAEVSRVLAGEPHALESALAAHQAALADKVQQLGSTVERLRGVRPATGHSVRFALPWPWGGEPFELRDIQPLNYITGPLGSGKTRLAMRLAEELPDAVFLGLDRLAHDGASARARLTAVPDLASRVDHVLDALVADGATASGALLALLVALESDAPSAFVVDMVEQDLDDPTQRALIAHLRHRAARPLFLMTRSSAILDLAAMGPGETIIFCPANHSPPSCVIPCPGAAGYEAVATCLATPAVRARIA